MYYSEEEKLPRAKLEELMLERLKALVERVYERVPFYRKKFDEVGVKPSHIKSLKDISKLPFTTKADLRDNYPFGMFATPMTEVVRVHASSGTTGKPTVAGYTAKDIDTWAGLMARAFVCAGVRKGDILHNAYGYGLFTGGLGAHYGAEKLGITVVPVSGGNTQRQIMLLEDFGATVLCATPSYTLNLAGVMREMGVTKDRLKLRIGVLGAEPWSENMRAQIEEQMGIDAIDIYGLSEVIGPGVSCECIEAKNGPHIFMDHFLPEIINPDTGEVLKPGEKGELVFTTLTKEAFPLIRYRTRDISILNDEPCKCGRVMWRMQRVTGRSDDMLIIRGVNVFPSQIESVILRHPEVEPHYIIEVDRKDALDVLTVKVEVSEKAFSDEIKKLEQIEKRLEHDIKDFLGVTAKVQLVEPRSIKRSEGKAQRVIDRRKI